jgi:CheY-like chemotaxis protein
VTVRVLIVDDQEPFRVAAQMVVEATEGFEVVGVAETGESSLEMARELMPDLVLMDVNLRGSTVWKPLGRSSRRSITWWCSCSRPTPRRNMDRGPPRAGPPNTSRSRYSARSA